MEIKHNIPDEAKKIANAGATCCISEKDFPNIGRCCSKSSSIMGTVYNNICPYSKIWTSMPHGSSLKITYIFECTLLGHGRRIKE